MVFAGWCFKAQLIILDITRIPMIIPIPRNLDEQLAIAKKIEKKTEELNKTSQAIDIQLEAIQALPAAILREVFDFQEANA